MQETNKRFEIKFGGDLHEVPLDLLVESLVSYSSLTQEVSAYIIPGFKVDINIKAHKEGSFIVLLDLVSKSSPDLFSKENIGAAANIFEIVGGLFALKHWISKFGKSETVKSLEGDNIEIANNNGSIIINQNVYNIYQENPKVRQNLRSTFLKLKESEDITNFSIKGEGESVDIFNIPKSDFEKLATSDDELPQTRQKLIKENQEISVFKVVFRENYKWEFFYSGSKIYASVKDESFFSKIEKGEIAFRSGDKLIVDMEIEQYFNETANTFVNDGYNIVKVIEHIPRTVVAQNSFSFE
jgi:hypothetical protein